MTKASDLMTKNPAVSTPDMNLTKVAKLMADHNVGAIPVVENKDSGKLVGIVTDRDIAVRCVAEGRNPEDVRAGDIMSTSVVTVREDADVDEITRVMEKNMIRRVPVLDNMGSICGIVAQADVALHAPNSMTGDTVEKISKPTSRPSNVD